jgi:hypothetical protein
VQRAHGRIRIGFRQPDPLRALPSPPTSSHTGFCSCLAREEGGEPSDWSRCRKRAQVRRAATSRVKAVRLAGRAGVRPRRCLCKLHGRSIGVARHERNASRALLRGGLVTMLE